jgi:eukaryotic-like serine/threonine-protein kinase
VVDARTSLEAQLAGRYAIERELGRGGMATVYLARDLRHRRAVALKVMNPGLESALGAERFRREIAFTSRLQHPDILGVYDSGEADGRLWYVMPYVEGESLRDRLKRDGQLPIEESVRIARQIAMALDHAHRRGVVHRDVKPENVLLANDGRALLSDFGLARFTDSASAPVGTNPLTGSGFVVGTPAYMSPEQATGEFDVDERTDVYALGCVLFEMLAGQPPFTGESAAAIVGKRVSTPAPPVSRLRGDVPPAVELAVDRALVRLPSDRFASAGAFAEALAAAGVTPPGTSSAPAARTAPRTPTTPRAPLAPPAAGGASSSPPATAPRRRWALAAAVAVAALLVALGIGRHRVAAALGFGAPAPGAALDPPAGAPR